MYERRIIVDDREEAYPPISASEVNRFCYCPWQWYYERVYGQAYIKQQVKARNAARGLDQPERSLFNKGLAFHENYLSRYHKRFRLKWLVSAVLLAAVFLICAWLSLHL